MKTEWNYMISCSFVPMAEWIEYGYWGMFLAAFLAATVLPFSSDVLLSAMLVAEFDALNLWIFASIGNWLGGLVSYGMGYLGKIEWIEKYLRVKKEKVDRFRSYAEKYGSYFALITWLPIVGDPMAIALGFVKTPLVPTAIWMFVGKSMRYAVIIWLTISGIDWWNAV